MKIVNYAFGLLLGLTLFPSCSDTRLLYPEEGAVFRELGLSDRRRLDIAANYVRKNASNLMFLTARGLNPQDLKYGLAQQMTYKGHVFLKIPAIRGFLVPGEPVSKSLRGDVNRHSVIMMYDSKDEIFAVNYMEELPEEAYADRHTNDLYYRQFVGDANIYNSNNEHIGYSAIRKPRTRSIADSTFVLDEVEVIGHQGGGDSGWGDVPPGGGYNEGDGSFSPQTCPVCGAAMNEGDPVCPNIASHYAGSGGSENSGGNGGGEEGVYKKCSLDSAGRKELNTAIKERIDSCKLLKMMRDDLTQKRAGFEDVIQLDTIESADRMGRYDPNTKNYFTIQGQIYHTIGEEYVHLFQDNVYAGGILQYAYTYGFRAIGSTNIEFEAKIIGDIAVLDASSGGGTLGWGNGLGYLYEKWISELDRKLRKGTLSYSDIEAGYEGHSYQEFMEDFARRQIDVERYGLDQINPNLHPEALIYLFAH